MSSAWNNLRKNYDRITSCSDTYCPPSLEFCIKKVIFSVIRLTEREWNFKRKTCRGLLE